MPYVKGISEQVSKIFSRDNVKIQQKPFSKNLNLKSKKKAKE